MKKLTKKQKLIGAVAIIIITVILAIVITTNIINNGQVTSEGYYATAANAGSSLISNYILNGITIGGITGKMEVLDTSDASAYAEDIAYGKVAYARGERIVGTRIDEDTNLDLKDIYYADIEGDGIVDGVIFADLAVGGSGQWGKSDDFISWGTYEVPIEKNLKRYYIEEESYTDDFGTGKVIAPIDGTTGNDRFYVMALDDFDSNQYAWYTFAVGNLNPVYNVGETANDFAASYEEPTGKINTQRMIKSWNESQYGEQYEFDIWGIIQDEVEKGWFVPSKSEWAAFGDAFNIDDGNYEDEYNLSEYYWSSSQHDENENTYMMNMAYGIIDISGVAVAYYIRLATTF